MKMRVAFLLALASLPLACEKLPLPGGRGTGATPTAAPAPPAVQQGKALLDQGQLDAALAKLQELPDDPVGLYYQGVIYARKGSATPLPEAGFRDEDKLGVQALERAVSLKPEFAAAHFLLAETLAPYTLKRHGPAVTGRRRGPRQPSPAPDDPDITPERVARAYQAAVAHDKTSKAPTEALLRYAREMNRPEDAEPVYLAMLERDKESAEPHVTYGDFLYREKKDPMKAIDQYQLALVWKPQDTLPKDRICDIYLDLASEHFDKGEWATAEARLRDARKFVTTPGSPQEQRLRELQSKLGAIRH
jgi:tetratricopeptide (TPR) repeat protein